MNIQPKGFSEAGICTSDMDVWINFLQNVAGWDLVWEGHMPEASKNLWGFESSPHVRECLLACPGHNAGRIRLFQIKVIEQESIRAGTRTWDSGGHFDLDLRTRDLTSMVNELRNLGWQGVSDPITWQFDKFQVREWLSNGPDDVVFAVIQRIAPPLEDPSLAPEKLGNAFNSSQIVSDMNRSIEFYQQLGFNKILHQRAPMPGRGGEVLGLSPHQAATTVVDLAILQPGDDTSGSVELVKIEGIDNLDVSDKALPYNLGLNLLRFPVSNLEKYKVQLIEAGIELVDDSLTETSLQPYGDTTMFAVRTPDGAWLEFFQDFQD